MSEKLCLQWNDFQDNVRSAFGNLRESTDFVDVTLACEDGHQIEAHKVILAESSPFFQSILLRNQHSHPLIYMRGVKSDNMTAMVDFLYCGEANVDQENMDPFLAFAEELQLKGLWGPDEDTNLREKEPHRMPAQMEPKPNNPREDKPPQRRIPIKESTSTDFEPVGNNALVLPTQAHFSGDLRQLDETVKLMMETSQTLFSTWKQRGKICKVCGKEGHATDIMRHIEANHLEGVSVPCNHCDKLFRSRIALSMHA